jgi:thiamine-phosphate pyrophosphorylase
MSVAFPTLYAIIDPSLLKVSELSFAEKMAESGVQLLQYRDKHAATRQIFEVSNLLSHRLSSLARTAMRPVRFIVNDRPDIARLVGAGGVHVGQHDLGVEQARAIMGREPWVGVSTHTIEQVEAADRTSADYVAFGPVFVTATKEQADPVVGLRLLAEARTRTSKPLVAIGGITLERAADTYRAGADSLAVARDLLAFPDPGARARAFLNEAARAGRGDGTREL